MIRAEGVSFRRGKKVILSDVACRVPSGQVTMLLGPNGAGKTTLLDILAGYRSPDLGAVFYQATQLGQSEQNIANLSRLAVAHRRAVVSQKSELQFPFSVRDVVLFGRHPHNNGIPSTADDEIVRQAMIEIAAEHLLERNYMQLSGGEQQMVQLARALAQLWQADDQYQQHCLFLDEATANLDMQHQAIVCDLMARFTAKGCAILMIAHDLNIALRYGQHFILLKGGRVRAEGAATVLEDQVLLEDVFDCRLSMCAAGDHNVVFPQSGM